MPLDTVQVKFVNETVRPTIERLILFRSQLDAFVLDFDNQQTPLPTDTTVLDDAIGGGSPRADAPQLQGQDVAALRNFCAGMRDQISAGALNSLVAKSVRSVEAIIRQ